MKNFISIQKAIWLGLAVIAGLCILYFSYPPEATPAPQQKSSLSQKIAGRFMQEFLMTRDPMLDEVPRERILKAFKIAQERRAMRASDDLPIFWEERGPNNVGGRTRGVLIDANDPTGQTIWAGGVAGGLWRTNDIDAPSPTWVPINDLFQNLALSTITQDPSNLNNLYFGTGECWGNWDAVRGLGAWRSTDGGANWEQMPPLDGATSPCIAKMVVDASGDLFAATTGGLRRFDPLTATWPVLLNNGLFANHNFVTDLEIAANGDMYCSTFSDGVYRSIDNGATWTAVNTGLPTSNFGRVELATAPTNANVVYVIFADTTSANSGGCHSFYQSTNSGSSWTAMTCPGSFGKQAWYDLILAVDPTDENRVYAGGVNLCVTPDAGANWDCFQGGHVDHHALVYYPGDPNQLLVGNDGGMYKSYNAAIAAPDFSDKNSSYNVTQFYGVSLHPGAGSNYMLGGTQDNATPKFTMPGLGPTTCVLCCCDGGWSFIDEDDPMIQIASTQNGSFNVSTDGGLVFNNIVPGNDDRLFITPAEYDHSANIMYYSDTRGRFGRVNDVGGANTNTSDTLPAIGNNLISALAVSPTTPNRIFVGTWNGIIARIDNADQAGMSAGTALTNPGVGGWISSITIEPANENHILITFSNYGVNSIWETTDGGTTWTSIEGDLPDMPVRWIIFWPGETDRAMIGTELGVWYAKDLDGPATNWYPTNESGLANVRIDMLRDRKADKLVVAATHGRGMYSSDYFTLLDSCQVSLNLPGIIASGLYMASEFITSDGTVPKGNTVTFQAGEEVALLADFTAESGSNFWALIKDCTPGMMPLTVEESEKGPWAKTYEKPLQKREVDGISAGTFARLSVSPNPARTEGSVQFELPETGYVRLYLMNARGQLQQTLADGHLQAGPHSRTFDATGLPGGIYLVVLKTGGETKTERVVVVE